MRLRINHVIWTIFLIGTGGIAWAVFSDGTVSDGDFLIIGQTLAVTGLMVALSYRRSLDEHTVFERGRQIGHDRGYREGRRTARPVIVPMHRCPACGNSESRENVALLGTGATRARNTRRASRRTGREELDSEECRRDGADSRS
jgi:hypothetical protein